MTDALDAIAPLKTRKKRVGRACNHWLSDEAVKAKRNRRKLEQKWKISRSEADRTAYREACRSANEQINSSRQSHYQNRLKDTRGQPRERWKVVNELLHAKPEQPMSTDDEDRALCISFAAFFKDKISAIGNRLRRILVGIVFDPLGFDEKFAGDSPLHSFEHVTVDEVSRLLKSTSNKSSIMDFLPTSLLRECSNVFAPIIARLANLAFTEGVFHENLKSAVVSPLFKKPGLDRKEPTNFRPISNLNTIGKLLERLILVRLQPHVINCSSFNDHQSAYRAGHSTETALLRITNDALRAADDKLSTVLVALDLSAAFDTVDHGILVRRLRSSFGVTGTALDLLTSYLDGRSQMVRVGMQSSASEVVSIGVPQGSVLGPLLFTIFISPIANIVAQHSIQQHQYADDTTLYVSMSKNSKAQTVEDLQLCLRSVHTWLAQNDLALNPDKTDVLRICPIWQQGAEASIDVLDVAGVNIKPVDKVKLLGGSLDHRLDYEPHVKNV